MKSSFRPPAAASALACALLASCGGGSISPEAAGEPEAPFRSFAASAQVSTAAGTAPPALDAASLAEIQNRSRDRAVAVISKTGISAEPNAFTMPPMYFARTQLVGLAARGDTLAALNREVPPVSSPAVQAGLMQALWRKVGAGADTRIKQAFMSGATLEGQPGTWQRFDFETLSAQDLALVPNLRLSVIDNLVMDATWPRATGFHATWRTASGDLDVQMVRVGGPLLELAGRGFEAQALALPEGGWLVRITPAAAPADWTAASLDDYLKQVLRATAGKASSTASAGEMLLPVTNARAVGQLDRPGMTLAMDPVHADLRGLDGGGTYLGAPEGSGGLYITAVNFSYFGDQKTSFIFSPLNIYGAGSIGAVISVTNYGLPACPATAAELKPFYMAHIQPSGNLAMLARLTSFGGERCQ